MSDACEYPTATADRRDSATGASRPLAVLVVDDSPSQRQLLTASLRSWDCETYDAPDADTALRICRSAQVDVVISDWVMPGMSGPELCCAVRALPEERYCYFILLTSKTAKEDIAAGLGAGADDFLTKPMDPGEMQARLRAGQRILRMQADLVAQNRQFSDAFAEIEHLYRDIDRDLRAAAQLQKSLIPARQGKCAGADIGIAYQPAHHVGGDLVGYFQVSNHEICAYVIDVSGHGVSSALLTARLANFFPTDRPGENLAVAPQTDGTFALRNPARVAADLNARMQDETDTDQYFTMLLACIDLSTGAIRYCQAGHPGPALIRASGAVEIVGDGGPPIGLLPQMDYTTQHAHLSPGDQMLLYSDGITEATNAACEILDNAGLAIILEHRRIGPEAETLAGLVAELHEFCGYRGFDDDLSALLLTMPDQAGSACTRPRK